MSETVWIAGDGRSNYPYARAAVVAREPGEDGAVTVQPADGSPAVAIPAAAAHRANPLGQRADNCELYTSTRRACSRTSPSGTSRRRSHADFARASPRQPYEELKIYGERELGSTPGLGLRGCRHTSTRWRRRRTAGCPARTNQAVIVSGESGAGKTYNMAQVIAYLVRRIGGAAGSTDGASHQLTALMVQATPVLEALGNAATVRNHNSSRFGKFIKLVFERGGGRVCALRLQTFLLEKSRASAPPPTEATFHIFYYLLGGASRAQRSAWQLRDAKSHALTATAAKGTSTAAYSAAEAGVRYERLLTSLTDLGLNAEKQQAIFEILAGVLHLVDVSFTPSAGAEGKEGCAVADPAPLRKAAKLLGVGDLESALTSRTIRSGGRSRGGAAAEEVKLLHTAAEAAAARDASPRLCTRGCSI